MPPTSRGDPDGPDEVIHQSTRLQLVATLKGLPEGEPIEFARLKAIMKLTDGNLGAHLTTLSNAGYITVVKEAPEKKKSRTLITLTDAGRLAFERHIVFLRGIIRD